MSRPRVTLCPTDLMAVVTESIRPWSHAFFGLSATTHAVSPAPQATMSSAQILNTAL